MNASEAKILLEGMAKSICQCSDSEQIFCDKRCEIPEPTPDQYREIAALISTQQRQLAESEAGAGAMREALSKIANFNWQDNEHTMTYQIRHLIGISADAHNTTAAGASLLAEVERLRKQVQDMRNCENCTYRHGRHAQCDKCQTMELEGWKWRGEGE